MAMKYLVLLCDGMADTHNPSILNGKTPMESANKPYMDKLARSAELGMCRTVAAGLKPGTEVAEIWISSPVWGLRPVRAERSRRSKVPRPGMATLSPPATVSVIAETRAPKALSASAWLIPAAPAIASKRSFLVIVFLCCEGISYRPQ